MALKSISQRGKKPAKNSPPKVKKESPKENLQEVISRIKTDLTSLEKLAGE